MMLAIETQGLSKHYGPLKAVDHVDLCVRTGEIYGFLGLNGAGKTTTIRMLLGLIRPTMGQSMLYGKSVNPDAIELWTKVGSMVETPQAYPELTVRENLFLICRLRAIDPTPNITRVLEQMNLGTYADVKAKHLSLGNKQRLGLAKALIHNPQLLILDEPTNGLDPAGIVEIRHLLHRLTKEEGVTLFISSHQLDEVNRLADRIGIIHKGRLIKELDSKEIDASLKKTLHIESSQPENLKAALNELTGNTLFDMDARQLPMTQETLLKQLVDRDIPISDFHIHTESLEDYFLRVIDDPTASMALEQGGVTHA